MRIISLYFKTFITINLLLLISFLGHSQTVDNCLNTSILGESIHGHITSMVECTEALTISSQSNGQNGPTIITGVFLSTDTIKFVPGNYGLRIVNASHSENDEYFERPGVPQTHSATHIKVKPPSGGRFAKFKKKQKTLIFPNPANNRITISTKESVRSVIIYNLYGTQVITKQLKSTKEENSIEITPLNKGFYTVQLTFTNGKTKSETLIKN